MIEVYRRGIPVDACTTLADASRELGGHQDLLRAHYRRERVGFPKAVAKVGNYKLYVSSELEAFYNSVLWQQADKNIDELKGGGTT